MQGCLERQCAIPCMQSHGITKMTPGRLSRILVALALPLLLAQASDSIVSLVTPGQRLGKVHFPISCSPAAQRNFDQALTLLHTFFFPSAGDAFAAITKLEPSCA